MAARKLAALFAAILQVCLCQKTPERLPEFLAPLENHTVIQGREVYFTCVVNHLQPYKVAWIKSDTRAILAIGTHMVAHNTRLSVTHNGHNTWKLHVSNVQKNDSGTYMCQVNTDPMRSEMGYMKVVIPPDIKDNQAAEGIQEGGNIRLKCEAVGWPKPNVTWKREDGRNIILREPNGQKRSVKTYEGEELNLTDVQRQQMGTYLCIASNNVPPTVSKRYSVVVHFQPVIKVPNTLISTPVGSNGEALCHVEASPHAMNTWYRNTGEKVLPSDKNAMSEIQLNEYSWQMNLTVMDLKKEDFGEYVCSSVNAFGKADGVVRVQELDLPVVPTPSTYSKNADQKLRKKGSMKGKKKSNNSNDKRHQVSGHDGHGQHGNEDDLGTTQIIDGSTFHEGRRTERPLIQPSESPSWRKVNAANTRHAPTAMAITLLPMMFSASMLAF